jgi:NAD(P)-dependent dehydrogenase (short-subunit alcohol dehydrogenase family)
LARRGDHLVLLDVNVAGLEETVAELAPVAQSAGGSVRSHVVDVRDADAVAGAVEHTWAEFGRVDVMVNNAGIGVGGPAEEMSAAHWQRVFDVNISGVMHGVAAVYPRMVAAGAGQIVNIASLAGLVPSPFLSAYGASKHAVVGMSLSLASEASDTGVAITCVCPGFTETAILDFQGPDDLPKTSASGRGRLFAARVPGGIYPVDDLAADIERGIDQRKLLVITPSSARWFSRGMRLSPKLGVSLAASIARRTRMALGGTAPTTTRV